MKDKVEGPVKEAQVEEQVQPQPKEVILTIELAQALLNYLGQQPYQQVAGLVEGIQGSKFNY